jgi:hypothetical protein
VVVQVFLQPWCSIGDGHAVTTDMINFAPLLLGWGTLMQPVNFGLLALGVLMGWLLVWFARGVTQWAPLTLAAAALPMVQTLDPVAGTTLLVGLLSAPAVIFLRPWSVIGRRALGPVCLLVLAIVAAPALADIYRSFKPADRVALAGVALSLAGLLAVWSRPHGSAVSIGSRVFAGVLPIGGGLLALLERQVSSGPRDWIFVACAALVGGPLWSWLRHVLGATGQDGDGASLTKSQSNVPSSVLFWSATSLPISGASALLAALLSTHGLSVGPQMLIGRPKLGWGMICAVLLGACLSTLLALVSRKRGTSDVRWRQWAAWAVIAALFIGGLALRGIGGGDLTVALLGAGLAVVVISIGYDATWLVVGWICGQLVVPHLAAATKVGMTMPGLLTGGCLAAALSLWIATVVLGGWPRR